MRAYSQDLRDRVISSYRAGETNKSKLSRIYTICRGTISSWINMYEATGDYRSKQGVGCGKKPTYTDKEAVLNFIEDNPDTDGIGIRDSLMPDMPMSTVYDTLKRMNITYKKKSLNISNAQKQSVMNM